MDQTDQTNQANQTDQPNQGDFFVLTKDLRTHLMGYLSPPSFARLLQTSQDMSAFLRSTHFFVQFANAADINNRSNIFSSFSGLLKPKVHMGKGRQIDPKVLLSMAGTLKSAIENRHTWIIDHILGQSGYFVGLEFIIRILADIIVNKDIELANCILNHCYGSSIISTSFPYERKISIRCLIHAVVFGIKKKEFGKGLLYSNHKRMDWFMKVVKLIYTRNQRVGSHLIPYLDLIVQVTVPNKYWKDLTTMLFAIGDPRIISHIFDPENSDKYEVEINPSFMVSAIKYDNIDNVREYIRLYERGGQILSIDTLIKFIPSCLIYCQTDTIIRYILSLENDKRGYVCFERKAPVLGEIESILLITAFYNENLSGLKALVDFATDKGFPYALCHILNTSWMKKGGNAYDEDEEVLSSDVRSDDSSDDQPPKEQAQRKNTLLQFISSDDLHSCGLYSCLTDQEPLFQAAINIGGTFEIIKYLLQYFRTAESDIPAPYSQMLLSYMCVKGRTDEIKFMKEIVEEDIYLHNPCIGLKEMAFMIERLAAFGEADLSAKLLTYLKSSLI